MAVSYPIPKWIEGVPASTIGALAAQGAARNQQLRIEEMRLAQESQMANMRLKVQQEESQREMLLRQQQQQIAAEYQRAEIGLRQAGIQQQQQRINLAVSTAARRYQTQELMRSEAQKLIQSGVPEEQAYMKSALRYGLGEGGATASEISALSRLQPHTYPKPEVVQLGGQPFVQTQTASGYHVQPVRTAATRPDRWADTQKLRIINDELKGLQTAESQRQNALAVVKKEALRNQLQSQSETAQQRINELKSQRDAILGGDRDSGEYGYWRESIVQKDFTGGKIDANQAKRLLQQQFQYTPQQAEKRVGEWSGTETATAPGDYKDANDVRSAYKAGTISKEEATKILQDQFGYQ